MPALPTVDTTLCAESFGESTVGQCQGRCGRKESRLTRGPLLFVRVLTSLGRHRAYCLFFLVMLDETWLYFQKASVLKIPFGTICVSGWPCWQGPVKEAGLQRSLQKALFSLLQVEGVSA